MRFPPSLLDEIRARVSVSSVIGRHVQWDRRKSNPGRGDFWACCPFHQEKTPSFHAEDRKGRYHCFGCKVSGDIFTFLVEREGLPFPEAVERLAAEAGLPMPSVSPEAEAREEERASLYDVMEKAALFFEDRLQSPEGAHAREYLRARGLPPEVQTEFRLGYAPDGKYALKTFLTQENIKPEQMVEAGLLISGEDVPVAYDRFRDRIMFPIRNRSGRVIAFGGRALREGAQAKYLNSPDTPLFHKGTVLYNLDRARGPAHEKGTVIAVEGYMDTIAMTRAGFPNTVAPLGTALTEEQLHLLWRMAPEPILCFDGDAAGIKAAYRALDLALPLLQPGQSLRFALLPEGQDPDDLLAKEGANAVAAVIEAAEPMVEVMWRRALDLNDRATPERRARFEAEIGGLIATIADPKVRTHYGAEIARRLEELWAPSGRPSRSSPLGRWRARAPFTGKGRRFPAFDRPWEVPLPPSRELKALSALSLRRLHERRERLILLGLVNHPRLLDEDLELLVEAEFQLPELDRLRREILDIAALSGGLDSDGLRNQLRARGVESLLVLLDRQAERLGEWFVLPGAALQDARTGYLQMLSLHRKSVVLNRALKGAEERFAAEPSDENLSHLNDIRNELSSTLGEEALIEGFGEASGRAVGNVA